MDCALEDALWSVSDAALFGFDCIVLARAEICAGDVHSSGRTIDQRSLRVGLQPRGAVFGDGED